MAGLLGRGNAPRLQMDQFAIDAGQADEAPHLWRNGEDFTANAALARSESEEFQQLGHHSQTGGFG